MSDAKIFIHGGRDVNQVFSDCLVMSFDACVELQTTGQDPGPRFAHTVVRTGKHMVVFGGLKSIVGDLADSDLYLLDIDTLAWSVLRVATLSCRFAHQCFASAANDVVIFGGVSQDRNLIVQIDVEQGEVKSKVDASLVGDEYLPVRNTASLVLGQLVCIGGGCNCFAFGSILSPSFTLNIGSWPMDVSDSQEIFVRVEKREAEAARATLMKMSALDKSRRSRPDQDSMLIPVLEEVSFLE